MLKQMLSVLLIVGCAQGSPTGAPATACPDMEPNHGQNAPQDSPAPYTLTVIASTCPSGGDCYEVTLSGDLFRGFLIQGRYIGDEVPGPEQLPVGTFEISDESVMQYRDCEGAQDSVTHVMNDDKESVTVFYNPGGADLTGLQIVATAVQVREVFWTGIRAPVA